MGSGSTLAPVRPVRSPDEAPTPAEAPVRVSVLARRAWADLLDGYATASTLRPAVVALHVMHCRELMRRTGLGPRQLTPAVLVEWLAAPEWATRTRKAHRASVAAVLDWAVDAGRLDRNPIAGIYASTIEHAEHPARAWARDAGIDCAATGRLAPAVLAGWRAAGSPEPARPRPAVEVDRPLTWQLSIYTEHPARAWARRAGIGCAATGQLPARVIAAWQAAGSPAPVEGSPAWRRWAALLDAFAVESRARGNRRATIRARRYHCYAFAAASGLDPAQVTRDDLIGWLASEQWAPATRRAVRSTLAQVFGFGYVFGWLATNPAADLPRVREPRGVARPAPDDAIRAAANTATPRVRFMVLLAAYAGLRRGEIARLRVEDFTDAGIHVQGKGGVSRLVPVHPALADAFADYRAGAGIRAGWLFPGRDGRRHITEPHAGRSISRTLPAGVTAHMLRHRFASAAYSATHDIRSVQELLGHASPAVTARYTAAPTASLITTVRAVPRIAGIHPVEVVRLDLEDGRRSAGAG